MGRLFYVTFLAFSLSGCAVILPGRAHHKPDQSSSKPGHSRCKQSQEWDGEHCRHKGKGSGSRKHDD